MKRCHPTRIPLHLLVAVTLPVLLIACGRVDPHNACALLTKADVENVLGQTVTRALAEPARNVTLAGPRVIHSTAACSYLLEPVSGRPARIRISVDIYGDSGMQRYEFSQWPGAWSVAGLGTQAWQDATALEIFTPGTTLTIETDETQKSPPQPVPLSDQNRDFPAIQLALAHIAVKRL
jgi:hypothetical protein